MWKAACQNWSSPSSPSSNLPKNILWKSNKAKHWGISMSEQAEPLPQSETQLIVRPDDSVPVRAEPVEASPAGGTPLDSPLLCSDPSTGSGRTGAKGSARTGTESSGRTINCVSLCGNGSTCSDIDIPQYFALLDFHKIFFGKFEDGDEGDDQFWHAAFHIEQFAELDKLAALQTAQDMRHLLAHRKLFAEHFVMRVELGARQQAKPGQPQIFHADFRHAFLQ